MGTLRCRKDLEHENSDKQQYINMRSKNLIHLPLKPQIQHAIKSADTHLTDPIIYHTLTR